MNDVILKKATSLFEQVREAKDGPEAIVQPLAFGIDETSLAIVKLPMNNLVWPSVFRFLALHKKAILHVFEAWRVEGEVPPEGIKGARTKDAIIGVLWTPEETVLFECRVLKRPRKGRRTGEPRVIREGRDRKVQCAGTSNPFKTAGEEDKFMMDLVGEAFMSPREGLA